MIRYQSALHEGHRLRWHWQQAAAHTLQQERRPVSLRHISEAPERSAGDDPHGIRVPAGDLERIVVTAITDRLKDGKQMHRWLNSMVLACDLPALLKRFTELASLISCRHPDGAAAAHNLMKRVQISKTTIEIRLSAPRLMLTSLQTTMIHVVRRGQTRCP